MDSVVINMETNSNPTPSAGTSDSNTTSTLLSACKEGNAEVVKILFEENGALINQLNDKGESALLCASATGYTEIVKILLQNRAQVDLQNKMGGLLYL